MTILIYIVVVIAALVAAFLIAALFVKNTMNIEKEVIINKPKQEVFNFIKYLGNQNKYSKWVMLDTNVRIENKGTDGTVGFFSAWDSDHKQVGKGEQRITGLKEGERLDIALHFIKPFDGDAKSWMTTETISGTHTKVKWGFNSTTKYPRNMIMALLNFEKVAGNDLQTGLNNLKTVLEKQS